MAASICTPSIRTNSLTMSVPCSKGIHDISKCKSRIKDFSQTPANFSSVRTGFGLTFRRSRPTGKRDVVAMVVPYYRGRDRYGVPPDLPSALFHQRIIYLGMPLFPAVTQLLLAEFMYLTMMRPGRPIYMYINSTGIIKDGYKYGSEAEAFSLYEYMQLVKEETRLYTLCIGNAWGEAALLLAGGTHGCRAALPSTTIMLREPMSLKQGQATDLDMARRGMRADKNTYVSLMARSTGQPATKVEQDIRQPKYFSSEEAVEYGIIDKVVHLKDHKDEVKPNRLLDAGGSFA